MATWDDVRAVALALPETAEHLGGHDQMISWQVKGKYFVWERPLRKSDFAALGDHAPSGPILGARVADAEVKEALLAEGVPYFTTPHFDGYPIVLVRLDDIGIEELTEVVTDAWLCRAPVKVRKAYLDAN